MFKDRRMHGAAERYFPFSSVLRVAMMKPR